MTTPSLSETLPQAAQAIHAAETVLLACHVNPDGDALGSLLGLAHALAPLHKPLTLLSQDGVPDTLRFLPGSERVQTGTTQTDAFDLAVVIDCGDLARAGESVTPLVTAARTVLDIDHHVPAGAFGDTRVLSPASASSAEIVYQLIVHMGLPITKDVATCLWTGVATDTGSFRFANVTPQTLHIAAALREAGAVPADVAEHVFDNKTLSATCLLGYALTSLQASDGGRLVWATLSQADFHAAQATDEDSEGIVSYVRGVRGADVGVLLRDVSQPADALPTVRVSLRGRESVDVSAVAAGFGGGGHRMAAGCTLRVSLADAEAQVLAAVRAALSG